MFFKAKYIPNVLSVIRLLLVGVFIGCFFAEFDGHFAVALAVFIAAGLTDVLDGWLARRNGWITKLGKILDPLADKTMQFAAMICLMIAKIIPLWFFLVFAVKDLVTVVGGALVIRKRNVVVVSKWYGKAAVVLFFVSVGLCILLRETIAATPWLTLPICLPTAIFAAFAFVAYLRHYLVLRNPSVDAERVVEAKSYKAIGNSADGDVHPDARA